MTIRAYGLNDVTTDLTITETVVAADKTADAFNLGPDIAPATISTHYNSLEVILSGVTALVPITTTVTGMNYLYKPVGGAYGAVQPPGTFNMFLGDAIKLDDTSGPGATDVHVGTLNINGVTDSWTVSNTAITTAFMTASPDKSNNIVLSNANLTAVSNDATSLGLVRTNDVKGGHRQIEFTVGALGELIFGLEDGTVAFQPSTIAPGQSGNKGVAFTRGSWGWEFKYNGSVIFHDYASAGKALAIGDTYSLVQDLTLASGSRTVHLYQTRSGVTTELTIAANANNGTDTSLGGLTFTALHGYAGVNAGSPGLGQITLNAGATAFARALGPGEIAFGAP